jgi:hypothetical protein
LWLRVVARVGQILLQLLALVLGVVEQEGLGLELGLVSLLQVALILTVFTQLLLVVVAQLHQAQTVGMVVILCLAQLRLLVVEGVGLAVRQQQEMAQMEVLVVVAAHAIAGLEAAEVQVTHHRQLLMAVMERQQIHNKVEVEVLAVRLQEVQTLS